MRDFVKRLDRLEGAIPAAQIGRVMRIRWAGDEDAEPCAATCEGVTLRRTPSESEKDFMERVRDMFPETPGKVRRVWIEQSRPPFLGPACPQHQ